MELSGTAFLLLDIVEGHCNLKVKMALLGVNLGNI